MISFIIYFTVYIVCFGIFLVVYCNKISRNLHTEDYAFITIISLIWPITFMFIFGVFIGNTFCVDKKKGEKCAGTNTKTK